jgi:Skp family chaperone for outer membrane proteins
MALLLRHIPLAMVVCATVMFGSSQASAQSGGFSLPDVPVLTIAPDRLFSETLFGQALSKAVAERGQKLAAENRRIERELADEEGELTGLRDTLSAEDFRDLADVFDVKVTSARTEQDEKARVLAQTSDIAERRFLVAIAPVMEVMMNEKGASVILDRRAVFVSADATDVTEDAIARIDARLGEGTSLEDLMPPSEPAPEQ